MSNDSGGHPDHGTQTAHAAVIAELREQHRIREDLVRARTRLTNQIKAIQRRLNGGHTTPDTHLEGAAENEGQGHNETHFFVADNNGQSTSETHRLRAEEQGPLTADAHTSRATEDEGQGSRETHARVAWSATVVELATLPLADARATIDANIKPHEKRIRELARELPIWDIFQDVRGFGELAFGQIIAEAGDLSKYANPAKLWKRMGCAVIDGERQQKKLGAAALEHGYSPRRRSLVWNVGECLVKLNQGGPYRTLYDERKKYEAARPWCGKCKNKDQKGEREHCTKGHVHNRAKRYMEKRLLRDLWEMWNDDQLSCEAHVQGVVEGDGHFNSETQSKDANVPTEPIQAVPCRA
jgi:hypothetical protein